MLTREYLDSWMGAVETAPIIPGRGKDCIAVHVPDTALCDAELNRLEEVACSRVRLSLASKDAAYSVGKSNLQSGYVKTNRKMLVSIGKRALKSFFLNSSEGEIYKSLVLLIHIGPQPAAEAPASPL